VRLARDRRPSLLGGLIVACALALLVWRAMADAASGSESRVVSIGTPLPGLAADDRRYALIVAVDGYDDPSLPSLPAVRRDAEELHDALIAHAGFPPANVRRIDGSGPQAEAPTRSNILRALHQLAARVPAQGSALFLVVFSGRGAMAGGRPYLLPRDAVAQSGDALLAGTSVDFGRDIAGALRSRGIDHLLLMVDSTLAAPGAAGPTLSRDFVNALGGGGAATTVALHAASPGGASWVDPAARRSFFLRALADGIRGQAGRTGDGWITLGSLLTYVQQVVPERARRVDPGLRQEPTLQVQGILPHEIRFARPAASVASSASGLRCALQPAASGGGYEFDVAASDGARVATTVDAVHVVSGGTLAQPFGSPVALDRAQRWPVRRTAPERPLLAVARTSIGQCAAYVEPARAATPVYEVRWQSHNAEGIEYKEVFHHPTENRHGRTDVVAAGVDRLRDEEGRITRVEYSCEGAACGWSYHPEPSRGYAGDVTVSAPGAFSWRRRWDGEPAMDVYTAYYEMPVRTCVAGCP
jgi:uncharacterized caspase-like protein